MTQPIPATMRALVLKGPGAYEIQDAPVPQPDAGEVLCQVGGVAICGSDPEVVRGDLAGTWPPAYPFIPGHEWSGRVVAVGPGVVGLEVGDRVAGQAHKGCGICAHCLSGRYTICENYGRAETGHRHYGFITPGAYAQYIAVSVKSVNRMPPTISFREGALVDPAGVVMHGLELAGENPELWELYRQVAKPRKISPQAIAIADFMNVPQFSPLDLINYQGRVGDPIKIHCKDDIGLVSVEISIDRQDGTDVEKGMAAELDASEGFWVYKATQPVPLGTDIFIEVNGLDHAGHPDQNDRKPGCRRRIAAKHRH